MFRFLILLLLLLFVLYNAFFNMKPIPVVEEKMIVSAIVPFNTPKDLLDKKK